MNQTSARNCRGSTIGDRPCPQGLPRSMGVVLLLVLALAGCGDGGDSSEAMARAAGNGSAAGGPGGGSERATPVSGRTVVTGDLEVTLRASTSLRARMEVEVVPRQAGVIREILVEEGARVEEGQRLAVLDDSEWRLQLQQAESRWEAARDAVERARSLQELELISAQEVERLASDARVAEADLGLAELRVEQSEIRSPIRGTVTHRYIERGQQVNTTNPAFGLADLDQLEARVAIPERDASRIQVGQAARVLTQEGGSAVSEGVVERIRPVVDAESGTVQVTVRIPATGNGAVLRPGQFVNVDIVTEVMPDRITLPRTAVLVDGAAPRVYLVRGDRAEEREVELGYSRRDQVEIRSGVEAGDTVVVVGQDNLRPQATIRMMQLDGEAVVGSSR
ncbi:MAG: efflux RND transporter periplasmic adaptor subunit [Gemmatimonadales bacterium]|nr:MAG: efflux RND transporter periplasmic adaptor subunit [Gemmatimonadales bacterium]